jgi:hypothetical protein
MNLAVKTPVLDRAVSRFKETLVGKEPNWIYTLLCVVTVQELS